MKNKSIKNIVFYIALIPYAILAFMCIYYAIVGYGYNLGKTAYGFLAVGNFLPDVFSDILDMCLEPIPLCTVVLWIGYQLYYFISFKSDKKEPVVQEGNGGVPKTINLKKILFFVSISCWGVYFASGIVAFFIGANAGGGLFSSTMEYGMDALLHTLFWNLISFSIIPILPIALLYIIIYVIVKKKEEKRNNNDY